MNKKTEVRIYGHIEKQSNANIGKFECGTLRDPIKVWGIYIYIYNNLTGEAYRETYDKENT